MNSTGRNISVSDADFAAIVKRYEDAGDVQNADIIRKQWAASRAPRGFLVTTGEVRFESTPAVAAPAVAEALFDAMGAGGNGNTLALDRVQSVDGLAPQSAQSEAAGVAETCRSSEKVQMQVQQDDRQVVVISGQRLGKSALMELQQNAARYLWLRDKADKMGGSSAPMVASLDAAGRMVALLDGEDLDAAVDVAMARRAPQRGTKTKRTGTDQ